MYQSLRRSSAIALLSLAIAAGSATAAELLGKVVKIQDGDTLTVLVGKQQVKVRIAGIDAPERKQPFGTRSGQNMARLAFGKEIRADCPKRDRYQRQICKVWVQPSDCPRCGMTLDVGLAQISAGLAWWYRYYANEQSAEDRRRYESEEDEARLRKRGLWQDARPVAPWEWRAARRSN